MARGAKTPPDVVFQIMATWAVTDNINETAKRLGLAESTVRQVVKNNKDKEEFTKLRAEKRADFSEKASRIIDKALNRLEKDIDDEFKSIPVNHLTTAIGVLTEKKLLIDGKPTERTELVGGEKLSMLAELAGYERRE